MSIELVITLSLLAEIVELLLQYSTTIKGSIERVFKLYRISIFIFLISHTGYLYIIFISLKFDILNFPIVLAISLKTIDIFTKIELIKKIYIQQDISENLNSILSERVPFWYYLISPITYAYLVYWGLLGVYR